MSIAVLCLTILAIIYGSVFGVAVDSVDIVNSAGYLAKHGVDMVGHFSLAPTTTVSLTTIFTTITVTPTTIFTTHTSTIIVGEASTSYVIPHGFELLKRNMAADDSCICTGSVPTMSTIPALGTTTSNEVSTSTGTSTLPVVSTSTEPSLTTVPTSTPVSTVASTSVTESNTAPTVTTGGTTLPSATTMTSMSITTGMSTMTKGTTSTSATVRATPSHTGGGTKAAHHFYLMAAGLGLALFLSTWV